MTAVKQVLKQARILLLMCSMVLILMNNFALNVWAEETKTYDIDFKAGAEGTVNESSSYTKPVKYGGTLDMSEIKVQPKAGYYFTEWSKPIEIVVVEKATYVAQYAKIIEEASYRVRYLDTYGNDLATPKVVVASKGGNVVEYAITIDGYTVDALSKTTSIAAEGTEINFVYAPLGNEDFTTEPGPVTVSGQPGDTGTAAVLPGTTPVGDGTTTQIDNPTDPGEVINQNDTPLSSGEEETIGENETPLANAAQKVGGMSNLIFIGVGILVVAVGI
ncbi:MAG: MucBP domain-containing protein, partial [Eubacterium sp.]